MRTLLLIEMRHIMTDGDEWWLNIYAQNKKGGGIEYICVLLNTSGRVVQAIGESIDGAESRAWALADQKV
jgi:hypothetical protein